MKVDGISHSKFGVYFSCSSYCIPSRDTTELYSMWCVLYIVLLVITSVGGHNLWLIVITVGSITYHEVNLPYGCHYRLCTRVVQLLMCGEKNTYNSHKIMITTNLAL